MRGKETKSGSPRPASAASYRLRQVGASTQTRHVQTEPVEERVRSLHFQEVKVVERQRPRLTARREHLEEAQTVLPETVATIVNQQARAILAVHDRVKALRDAKAA